MATYLVSQGSGIAVKGGGVKDAAWGSSRVWAHTLLKYEKAQKRMKQSLVFQQFWQELGAMTKWHVSKGGQKPNLQGSRPPFSMMLHCLMVKTDELVDLSRDAQDKQWAGKRCHCYCCCHSTYYLVTVFITITVMLVGIIVILILNIDTFSCIRPLFLALFVFSVWASSKHKGWEGFESDKTDKTFQVSVHAIRLILHVQAWTCFVPTSVISVIAYQPTCPMFF